MDAIDKFDGNDDHVDLLLRRRWRVGRPILGPSSASSAERNERKGDALIDKWLGSGEAPFPSQSLGTVGARVIDLSLSLRSALAFACAEIACPCGRLETDTILLILFVLGLIHTLEYRCDERQLRRPKKEGGGGEDLCNALHLMRSAPSEMRKIITCTMLFNWCVQRLPCIHVFAYCSFGSFSRTA